MTLKFYSKKTLLGALKLAGLPASYPSLLKYERAGVLNPPKTEVTFDDRRWRLYTEDEIRENVLKLKSYLEKKGELK